MSNTDNPSNNLQDTSSPTPTPIPALSESDHAILSLIWKYLKRPQDLDDTDTWPFVHIADFKSVIIPKSPSSAGQIPNCLIPFLEFDVRNYPTFGERSDHAAWSIDEHTVKNMPSFWQNVLFRILVTWMNCQEPRTRNSDKVRCIMHNLEGYDAYQQPFLSKNPKESVMDAGTPPPDQPEITTSQLLQNDSPVSPHSQGIATKAVSKTSTGEVTNSIRAITSLFANDKISGEETEPFIHQLQPVLDQMEVSSIPEHHRVSALFSILTGKARAVASKFNITHMSIQDFTESLKKELCLDPNIRERKKHRWNTLMYSTFRNKVQNEDEATRNCIEHVKAHQKDLPPYLLNDEALMERLRGIFKHQAWCQSLYERSSVGMSASAFEELLKTAAANADDRRSQVPPTNTRTYPVTNNGDSSSDSTQHNIAHLVAAFFARTPPPPRHRRPFRFRRNHCNKHRRSHIPQAIRRFRNHSRKMIQCFGCRQDGHILRNCPEREKYLKRFQFIRDLGTAAAMIVDCEEKEPDDDLIEVATFFLENDNFEDNDFEDFNVWLCDLLDFYDDPSDNSVNAITNVPPHSGPQVDPYIIKESIPELQATMSDFSVNSVFEIVKHLLLDTGSPKDLTPEQWLRQANWTPVRKLPLPSHIKPFRFAGQYVHPLYAACLIATITDIHGNDHLFRQVAFILPDIPIPFLVGLQTQRSLAFDICLRQGPGSHLKINKLHKLFPLFLQSHVWLQFKPCNQDPDPHFEWTSLINNAFDFHPSPTNYACPVDPLLSPVNIQDITQTSTPSLMETDFATFTVHHDDETAPSFAYATPPWERDDWISKTTPENAKRLHQALRHPTPQSLLKLYRQQNEGRRLPKEVTKSISNINCRPCDEHAQLPRRPKIAIPQPATPNVSVSLDVMSHTIQNAKLNILVMLDSGDMMLKLSNLKDDSARTAFNAYISRWISIFDAPIFTIVDRGTNLTNDLMATNLRQFDSQLIPIPTEAPWSIGNNERSHRFLHDAIEKLIAVPHFDIGHNYERLLAEVEMAWNFTQHTNRIIPHFYRFGTMPRVLGELTEAPMIQTRIALQEMARLQTEHLRANQVISSTLRPDSHPLLKLTLFSVGQEVWFHRRKYGWRQGTITRIDRPTIWIAQDDKTYPTHENRVRPYFGSLSLPPEIQTTDTEEQDAIEHPDPIISTNMPTQNHHTGRAPISELINGIFVTDSPPMPSLNEIRSDDNLLLLELLDNVKGTIDSNFVILTTLEPIKNLKKLPVPDQKAFHNAKREEIDFMIQDAVKPIPESEVASNGEIQPLKWVLNIKRSPNSDTPIRHRARLVSASNLSEHRFCVHGNAPTVAMNTIRALFAVLPTWKHLTRQQNDELVIFVRDVTKAYLQSTPSERLIYYQPPKEFFEFYPDKANHVWQAKVQIYGDTEAGRYWNKTVVPWYCNNILDYKQSIYDPSLLYSNSKNAATLLCTDDAANAIPKTELHQEAEITKRFKCRDAQYPPTDFKGLDIINGPSDKLILSQEAYLKKVAVKNTDQTPSKEELGRNMESKEISELRSTAGKLAWIATGTSPLSSYHASVALQRHKEQPIPQLRLLHHTTHALKHVQDMSLASLTYIPLDEPTTHIRIYTDGSYQNLPTKHSQIGFVIGLADKDDNLNLIHWHSSRAPRRPHSTEQSELLALYIALRCIENLRMILFQLLKKEVPLILYVDNESLWINMMNDTVPCIPEVGYRCREPIHNGTITTTCLIHGTDNPADAMTKAKPNKKLEGTIKTNKCITPRKRVFMLQTSKWRHAPWIPTSKVPMPDDPQVDATVENTIGNPISATQLTQH